VFALHTQGLGFHSSTANETKQQNLIVFELKDNFLEFLPLKIP
jgi:hypothetical protein